MNEQYPVIAEEMMQEEQINKPNEEEQLNSHNQKIKKERLFELPECSICFDELFVDICTLQCGHVFHEKCILENFKHRYQCPMCKFKIQFYHKISLFYSPTQRQHYAAQQIEENSHFSQMQNNIWKLNYGNLLISYQNLKFKLRKLSSSCLQKEKSARSSHKQIRQLMKCLIENQIKIKDLRYLKTSLQKDIKSQDRILAEKNKQLQQKQTQILNLKYLLTSQKQQTKRVKDSSKKNIQKLEKQNLYFCLQLQKAKRQLDKNQKLKKLVQSPLQFTNHFKSQLKDKGQSYKSTLKEFQQILTLQKAENVAQKTKNQNIKEKLQNQQKQIDQLKNQLKEKLKENRVLELKCIRLQKALNQSQKQSEEYGNHLNNNLTKNQQHNFDNNNFSNHISDKFQPKAENLNLNIKNNRGEKLPQKPEQPLVQVKISSLFSTVRPYGGIKPIQKINKKIKK